MKLTLNPAQFDQEMIKREISDNKDDDLQIISSEDKIEKDIYRLFSTIISIVLF